MAQVNRRTVLKLLATLPLVAQIGPYGAPEVGVTPRRGKLSASDIDGLARLTLDNLSADNWAKIGLGIKAFKANRRN